MVAVTGTVRVREDDITVSCIEAAEFTPAAAPEPEPAPETSAPPPASPTASVELRETPPSAERYAAGNGAGAETPATSSSSPTSSSPTGGNGAADPAPTVPSQNGGGAASQAAAASTAVNGASRNGNGATKPASALARSAPAEPAVPRRVNLKIRESDSPADDKMMLNDVKRILLDHAGEDDVTLEISSRGSVYRMDWTPIKVSASDELARELSEALGESGGASVESAAR